MPDYLITLPDGQELEITDAPELSDTELKTIADRYMKANDIPIPGAVPESTPTQYTSELDAMRSSIGIDTPISPPSQQGNSQLRQGLQQAGRTAQNIGKVYPALENIASMATSAYGVPLSGLAGLAALPGGLDSAKEAMDFVQNKLVYHPQTEAGMQLQQASNYPAELVEGITRGAGDVAERVTGSPTIGAAAKTALEAGPALLGGILGKKALLKNTPAKIKQVVNKASDRIIDKAVKSSLKGEEDYSRFTRKRTRSRNAIEAIAANKDNLEFTDEFGTVRKGLPESVADLQSAIDQTKRKVFSDYDEASKLAGEKGVKVSTDSAMRELLKVAEDEVTDTLSKETITYAGKRFDALAGKEFTPSDAQRAISILNESLRAYEAMPDQKNAGKLAVDALIANNLRGQLDNAISKTTGAKYADMKRTYRDLKTIERDVARAANAERKKLTGVAAQGLTDIVSAHQLIKGLANRDPSVMAAGGAIKGMAELRRYFRDPNRMIRKSFKTIDNELMKRTANLARQNSKVSYTEIQDPLKTMGLYDTNTLR